MAQNTSLSPAVSSRKRSKSPRQAQPESTRGIPCTGRRLKTIAVPGIFSRSEEGPSPIPNPHSDVNEIPPAVVKDLIALGSLDDSPSVKRDQLLARLKPFDRVNRLGWAPWYELAD